MVMARLCVSERFGIGLENMCERFLGIGEGEYNKQLEKWMMEHKLRVKSRKVALYHHVPIDRLGAYCCEDVVKTARLKEVFQKHIIETEQVRVWRNEVRTTRVLYDMEVRGVAIDREYCASAIQQVNKRVEEIDKELMAVVGTSFNVNSNQQMTKHMNAIGVYSPVMTDKNVQSWGKEALQEFDTLPGGVPPALKLVRERYMLTSLKGTFLEVFYATNGVLHATFNNAGTLTGRCSSSDPNVQNIPALIQGVTEDTKALQKHQSILSSLIGDAASNFTVVGMSYEADQWNESDAGMVAARRAIVPRPGYEFLSIDYAQMEMIVFLCYIGNQRLLQQVQDTWARGEMFDYHNLVAFEVWGVKPGDEGFDLIRKKRAKPLNLGLIYGIGIKKMAKQMGAKVEEAKEYKAQYFERIEGAEQFLYRVKDMLEARGYLKNMYGRRYYIAVDKAYIGVNYLDQGSCADFMKERMWLVREALRKKKLDAYLVLQVHDELVIEVKKEIVEKVASIARSIMEEKVFAVPLRVTIERCAESWLTGEKVAA